MAPAHLIQNMFYSMYFDQLFIPTKQLSILLYMKLYILLYVFLSKK